jgi:soluble lytic murein transglycosylase
MQLMLPTAKEVAGQLKFKGLSWPSSLHEPNINIALGTRYLRNTIKRFEDNLPIALAAYNVGPSRFKRWLAVRPDASNVLSEKSSHFVKELWIEEMPWDESRFYVKAVLRNFIVYQWLGSNKRPELTDPIWKKALEI